MLTLRLVGPRHVAHLAAHDSVRGWHTRCTLMWEGSRWISHNAPGGPFLVTLPTWGDRGGGRPLDLDDLRDVPTSVPLCTRCLVRVAWDQAAIDMALAARGA